MTRSRRWWAGVVGGLWMALVVAPLVGQELLADLSPGKFDNQRAPALFRALADGVLFSAEGFREGRELWFTSGTPQSTRLLRDLLPGRPSGNPRFLGTVRGKAMFYASNGNGEVSLWSTDGTTRGTEAFPRFSFWNGDFAAESRVAGENLFIVAWPGLWITDGTAASLRSLPGLEVGSGGVLPHSLTVVEDRVFLIADDGQSGVQLWVADSSGIRQLTQLVGSSLSNGIEGMTAAAGRLFFAGCDTATGCEPWISDGRANGTRRIVDLVPGPVGSMNGFGSTRPGLAAGESILFVADDGSGSGSWLTDGTAGGTAPIIANVTFVKGRTAAHGMVFVPNGFSVAGDLWVSDGTLPGTFRLAENLPSGTFASVVQILASDGDRVLFMIDDGVHGSEPWITDGTFAGTRMLADVCPGLCDSFTTGVARVLGEDFYFSLRYVGVLGQIWKTDGTSAGTELVADDLRGNGSVAALRTTATGIKLALTSGALGSELWTFAEEGLVDRLLGPYDEPLSSYPVGGWKMAAGTAFLGEEHRTSGGGLSVRGSVGISDGSPQGSRWVGGFGSDFDAQRAVPLAGGLVVLGESGQPQRVPAIYFTDGTSEGTRLVSQGFVFQTPTCGLFRLGEQALFFLKSVESSDLWRTDGSAAGTTLVREKAGAFFCGLSNPTVFAGKLYFFDDDNNLLRSDGTPEGTEFFFDLPNDDRFPGGQMAVAGSYLYFEEVNSSQSILWRTDGTRIGTVRLAPLSEGGRFAFWYLTALGDRLVFRAYRRAQGLELWISDGTVAGTRLLRDIAPGFLSSSPWQLHQHRGKVYFSAFDADHGSEFWVTDGSRAGTHLVRDISPGPASSEPVGFTTVGEALYFAASDGVTGSELWTSDGTELGSFRLTDIAPGPSSSVATVFATAGDRLLLSADDGTTGFEPWVLQPGGPFPSRCTTGGEDLCLRDGRFRVRVRWRNQRTGALGVGRAAPFSDRSGFFWFFDESNIELVVKVLDGSSINGFYWSFYGGLSDVEYRVEVTDLETGQSKRYRNPPGEICGVGDTTSIAVGKLAAGPRPPMTPVAVALPASLPRAKVGGCLPSSSTLCLLDGRFAVEVDWRIRNTTGNTTGVGGAIAGTDKSGYFWFFNSTNVELVVKMLDGRPVNGNYWLFYGALSNVEYTLRVTDTETGAARTYFNPRGEICGQADTAAFP